MIADDNTFVLFATNTYEQTFHGFFCQNKNICVDNIENIINFFVPTIESTPNGNMVGSILSVGSLSLRPYRIPSGLNILEYLERFLYKNENENYIFMKKNVYGMNMQMIKIKDEYVNYFLKFNTLNLFKSKEDPNKKGFDFYIHFDLE